MTQSVLDILIYVFDRHMLGETPHVPERDDLSHKLTLMGFAPASVARALLWLAELADLTDASTLGLNTMTGPARDTETQQHKRLGHHSSLRQYTEAEMSRLSIACRDRLMRLERQGILSPRQREIVIDRLLALDTAELDIEQLKWVVLMVLFSQPHREPGLTHMREDSVTTLSRTPPC